MYYINTSPTPEKPGKYFKTPFRRLRSIYIHLSGAEEVLIYTYLAPEKPDKYLYTPLGFKLPLATETSKNSTKSRHSHSMLIYVLLTALIRHLKVITYY